MIGAAMPTREDFKRMAELAGLSIPAEDVERLAPQLNTMYADLDRLRTLVTEDLEPAFAPALTAIAPEEASAGG